MIEDEYLIYLNELKKRGINMYQESLPLFLKKFPQLSTNEATYILCCWLNMTGG